MTNGQATITWEKMYDKLLWRCTGCVASGDKAGQIIPHLEKRHSRPKHPGATVSEDGRSWECTVCDESGGPHASHKEMCAAVQNHVKTHPVPPDIPKPDPSLIGHVEIYGNAMDMRKEAEA